MTVIAQDDFSTNYTNLSGNPADVGGNYSSYSGTAGIATSGGVFYGITNSTDGFYRLGTGTLADGDVYVTARDATDNVQGGSWARGIDSNNFYHTWTTADGGTAAYIYRKTAGVSTSLGGFTEAAGSRRLRMQIIGSSPTTLRLRTWSEGGSEGTTWGLDTTDNTAGNQTASGAFGIWCRRSTAASFNGDDFLVSTLDTYQPRPGVVSFGGVGIV